MALLGAEQLSHMCLEAEESFEQSDDLKTAIFDKILYSYEQTRQTLAAGH